jgi:Fe-S-cluster-containing hydrogenase component 2
MKRIAILASLALATLCLAGCPSGTVQQKAAQASKDAAVGVQAFQTAESIAHQQGLIPDADHALIKGYLLDTAQMGEAVDSCIKASTTSAGVTACVNTAINTVTTLNTEGALHLKSATAQNDFSAAMTGLKSALTVINTMIGGN